MTTKLLVGVGGLIAALTLISCGFVTQQRTDKAQEERLLKPGALDTGIATNFNEYRFKFMDRYRISHAWPVTSSCGYRSQDTKYKMGDVTYGEVKLVRDIYEEDGKTWQRFPSEVGPYNLSSYVRSKIVHQPIYENVDGGRAIVRYEDQEQGLQAMCFQAWVGTSHALTLMLYKRTLEDWETALTRWSQGSYTDITTKRFAENIGGNDWHVFQAGIKPRVMNRIAGAFELRILQLGNTGYTMVFELGANQDSLQNPQAHAAMQLLFRQLLGSVKVEPLTPTIEAELAELKAKAQDIQRQECVESSKKGKPGPWCKIYGFQ